MNTTEILTAIIVLAVVALIIGIILSIAEKVFKVEVDEKEVAVREELPGSSSRIATSFSSTSTLNAFSAIERMMPIMSATTARTTIAVIISVVFIRAPPYFGRTPKP